MTWCKHCHSNYKGVGLVFGNRVRCDTDCALSAVLAEQASAGLAEKGGLEWSAAL